MAKKADKADKYLADIIERSRFEKFTLEHKEKRSDIDRENSDKKQKRLGIDRVVKKGRKNTEWTELEELDLDDLI